MPLFPIDFTVIGRRLGSCMGTEWMGHRMLTRTDFWICQLGFRRTVWPAFFTITNRASVLRLISAESEISAKVDSWVTTTIQVLWNSPRSMV